MAAKCGNERFRWTSRSPRGVVGCGVWKGICKGLGSFFRYTRFCVNNDERVRFWHNPWCGAVLLCLLFPSCYGMVEDKGGFVKNHMIRSRVFCSWKIQPQRNLNDWEIGEMGWLIDSLERFELGYVDRLDELIWSLDENGFSVSSMYDALCPPAMGLNPGICV